MWIMSFYLTTDKGQALDWRRISAGVCHVTMINEKEDVFDTTAFLKGKLLFPFGIQWFVFLAISVWFDFHLGWEIQTMYLTTKVIIYYSANIYKILVFAFIFFYFFTSKLIFWFYFSSHSLSFQKLYTSVLRAGWMADGKNNLHFWVVGGYFSVLLDRKTQRWVLKKAHGKSSIFPSCKALVQSNNAGVP